MKPEHKRRQIIDKAYRRARNLEPTCFFSSCNGDAINSHSQSLERSLRNISVDNIVIGLGISPFAPPEILDDWFKEIGVRQASKFKGFCWKHDNDFFQMVDNLRTDNIDKQTLARLSFRTFAMEVRAKERTSCMLSIVKKESDGIFFTEDISYFLTGRKIFLSRDYPYYLNRFEVMFNSDNYDDIESAVFFVGPNIRISCSTCINPLMPFWLNEEYAEDEDPTSPPPMVFFTVLPDSVETMVIFTYFIEDKESVLDFINKHATLENIVFNYCEEVLFSPDFFRSLDASMKHNIVNALAPWLVWQKVAFPTVFGVALTSPKYY